MSCAVLLAIRIAWTIAARTSWIEMPASASFMSFMVPEADSAHMANPIAAAPVKAGQTIPAPRISGQTIRQTTMTSDAPALMPNVCGEASGLRVSVWISTPAMARLAPTAAASAARGRRTSQTSALSAEPSGEKSSCSARDTGRFETPKAMPATIAKERSTRKTAATAMGFAGPPRSSAFTTLVATAHSTL